MQSLIQNLICCAMLCRVTNVNDLIKPLDTSKMKPRHHNSSIVPINEHLILKTYVTWINHIIIIASGHSIRFQYKINTQSWETWINHEDLAQNIAVVQQNWTYILFIFYICNINNRNTDTEWPLPWVNDPVSLVILLSHSFHMIRIVV